MNKKGWLCSIALAASLTTAGYVSAGTSFEHFDLEVPKSGSIDTKTQAKQTTGAAAEVRIRFMPKDKTMRVAVKSTMGVSSEWSDFENLGTIIVFNEIGEGSATYASFKSGPFVWVKTQLIGSFKSN